MEEKQILSPEEQVALLANSADLEDFRERVNQAIKELAEKIQPIIDVLLKAFEKAFAENSLEEVIEQSVVEENHRVIYLALNHRKERVRKKNMKRFERIVKKHKNFKK